MLSRPTVHTLMTPLINDLSALSNPFIIVLDDYHRIHSPTVHNAVDFLLEYQPTQIHLLLMTREDPLLQLNRLRARNQLIESRMDDLRLYTKLDVHDRRSAVVKANDINLSTVPQEDY